MDIHSGSSLTPAIELPRLTLRIGLVGNRAAQSGADLASPLARKTVAAVLKVVGDQTSEISKSSDKYLEGARPTLRFVTGLADGADQFLADTALELNGHGWVGELFLILPYASYGSEQPNARTQLAQANWVLALDGVPPNGERLEMRGRAFEAQAWFLRQNSDLLIAIWDPANAFQPGGTEDSIRQALRQGLPVVWIHPGQPERVRILKSSEDLDEANHAGADWKKDLRTIVASLLDFPRDGQADDLLEFLGPPPDHPSLRPFLWKLTERTMKKLHHVQEYLTGNERAEGRAASPGNAGPEHRPLQPYCRYREHAEISARYYAGMYRGAFLLNYALGFIAVVCSAISLALEPHPPFVAGLILGMGELGAIFWILFNVRLARERQWHQKAMNFRFFAEMLRQMDFLAPLACSTPSSRPPIQYAANDPGQTWMGWLFRALVRQSPPMMADSGANPTRTFDKEYARGALRNVLTHWIDGQVEHHKRNRDAMNSFYETIEFWSRLGFFFVLACVATHLGSELLGGHLSAPWPQVCALIGIVVPALVLSFNGLRYQAECRRLKERSANMCAQLRYVREALAALENTEAPSLSWKVAARVHAVGQIFIDEVTDWQILYRMHDISEA